ncbi:MAG: tRNA (adenosine(37)-N6)-threonylcarbamoyltransferase complex transferase subunit TsaD [bacterium]|nr:tRNA (adenosine(37)-N6)-threonylcarbamoyltransferase complex transferase subunit TsaD [bacterium]
MTKSLFSIIILPITLDDMRILAIESSCDETAAAIVEDGWKVHSNVIASSLNLHKKTGGVVPEVAARAHLEAIIPVLEKAVEGRHFDAIAVTAEPGLVTSLLVGTETAKWLGYLWNKPVIAVNHIHGHVYANWLELDPEKDRIELPILALSVSGGHNELILMKEHGEFEIIGKSRDDAAGEAFDKVARILGLGYPGGPAVETTAKNCAEAKLSFPRAWLNQSNSGRWDQSSFDFSFSGLKSEVIREAQRRGNLTDQDQAEIASAFQEAVCDVLATKLIGAAKKHQVKEIHLTGGVSANQFLRLVIERHMKEQDLNRPFRHPKKMNYCTDNAAMIAAAAYFTTTTTATS